MTDNRSVLTDLEVSTFNPWKQGFGGRGQSTKFIDPCAAHGPTASDETGEVPDTTNQPGGIGRAGINRCKNS